MSSKPGTLQLAPVDATGRLAEELPPLSPFLAELSASYVPFYESVGFEEPWIGYFAREGDTWVGSCGFKGPPRGGRVEIAYVADPDHRGRGVATRMAEAMVAIAEAANPAPQVFAQTRGEESESTTILKKLGFKKTKTLDDPEVGEVWEWER